jgi:hypothetical protein
MARSLGLAVPDGNLAGQDGRVDRNRSYRQYAVGDPKHGSAVPITLKYRGMKAVRGHQAPCSLVKSVF